MPRCSPWPSCFLSGCASSLCSRSFILLLPPRFWMLWASTSSLLRAVASPDRLVPSRSAHDREASRPLSKSLASSSSLSLPLLLARLRSLLSRCGDFDPNNLLATGFFFGSYFDSKGSKGVSCFLLCWQTSWKLMSASS